MGSVFIPLPSSTVSTDMRLEPASIPPDRYKRYNATAKGKARRKTESESKHAKRLDRYLSRPFIAWDGEGINESNGSHTYVLLASSEGDRLSNRFGLATAECFEALLKYAGTDAIHVVYGGGYDINMMLRDLPRESLEEIYLHPSIRWQGYRLSWRAGKSLRIARGKKHVTLYDVLPFFQRSFVAACDEYLGDDWESREEIIREKQNRGTFDYENIDAITAYNEAELRNLVRLCNELRSRLHKVDIRVKRWDGPGAIATELFQRYKVKASIKSPPESVSVAARFAYAGGRFEVIRKGHSETGAYQYDIRSAYPSAMRNLPCLTHGKWSRNSSPQGVKPFGLYRIEYRDQGAVGTMTRPQPLWKRNPDGTVYFALDTDNFYWSPEAQLVIEQGAPIAFGYEYETDCDCEPFAFVEPLYNKRAALKKANDGAHVGLKLGLNSLYGKLAQQVGWSPGPPLRIPPFHCLEWAGYVTSHCRAQVYRAALLAPDDIIAFETDAVFSRVPLPVDLGTHLGQWEATEYASLTYLKSGMYFGTLTDGTEVRKTRGIDKESLTREDVITALTAQDDRLLHCWQTRFNGLGIALAQDFDKWRKWTTSDREITTRLQGKRIDALHNEYPGKRLNDGWMETWPGVRWTEPESHPYTVEWINPNPEILSDDGSTIMELRIERGYEEWQAYA